MNYITILIIVITLTLYMGVFTSEEFDYNYKFWGIVTFTFFGLIAYVGYMMIV